MAMAVLSAPNVETAETALTLVPQITEKPATVDVPQITLVPQITELPLTLVPQITLVA